MSISNTSLAGKLRRLGSNPDTIAANLKKAGIKGTQGDCDSCAIAEFLIKSVKGATSVSVTGEECKVRGKGFEAECNSPGAVREFIGAFDNGAYPDIDAGYDDDYVFGPRNANG